MAILSPASRNAQVLGFVNRPFKEALAKLGYEPGQTIEIVERFADNDETRLPALAAELVALQPRVLFTNTSAAATAAAGATRTIPIVVGPAGESVLMALAGGSLARPITNVTGFVLTSAAIDTKGIGLLIEAVPAARRIGLLVNPRNLGMTAYPAPQNAALSGSGVTFVRLEATGSAISMQLLPKPPRSESMPCSFRTIRTSLPIPPCAIASSALPAVRGSRLRLPT
ncbi:MAG: ABC transporter substrate binding protein [Vicinamibacterales bacterium]